MFTGNCDKGSLFHNLCCPPPKWRNRTGFLARSGIYRIIMVCSTTKSVKANFTTDQKIVKIQPIGMSIKYKTLVHGTLLSLHRSDRKSIFFSKITLTTASRHFKKQVWGKF